MKTSSSIRILDLCEFFSERGGGVRSYLERLGKAAYAAGHELTVVAPGPANARDFSGEMKLIRYRAPRMPYDPTYRVPFRLDVMSRVVAEERPDVVQISSPFAPALAARFISPSPLRVYFYHSDPIGCYVRPALHRHLPEWLAERVEELAWSHQRAVSASCDLTIVAGEWLRVLLQRHGCERVHTVPFGISGNDLTPTRRDEALRRRLLGALADEPGAALVLITGRLAVDKRQALLIDALVECAKTRPIALVVLGDGPERARLRASAARLRQATFLPFTQDRAEFAAILASADLLLHGSLCETFGFVVAEALASGTPLVVPRAGGAGALAHPDYAETYEPNADARAVARSVHELLARPRSELSLAARRAADALPTSERHFENLFSLYRTLLDQRANGTEPYRARHRIFHSVQPPHTVAREPRRGMTAQKAHHPSK